MAASIRPRKRTASRCVPETDRCTHVFEIAGYSLLKGLGAGECVRSATFTVGGHDWCVQYCPDGETGEEYKDYISVYLELVSQQHGEVRAACSFRLINQATGLSEDEDEDEDVEVMAEPNMYRGEQTSWGCGKFKKKSWLQASPYLRNDRLLIECNVTVVMGTTTVSSKCDIQVPPSELADHLGRLLETKQGQDVTFKVGRIVLAMRSPVFMAELYGPMEDSRTQSITVEEIQPAVFELLLQFIYTDSLPDVDELDVDDAGEFIKHLLVAADRYCMDGMKLICVSILSKRLDAENVVNILALADQYHCGSLKDACIEFMLSSSSIDDVIASKGYVDLKRASPAATVEIWEKAAKSRRI
ncbi:hypothetical protein PAHAL_6G077300 [Panicum hallii]|uniref:MATH domain-containing protein n=1 Tax=Panicum hallii TaxID=206008 RepID=A0A2S3I175_9POAL|nr:hypothetical protein PAHAL_6G077300 [Panicum hallii]